MTNVFIEDHYVIQMENVMKIFQELVGTLSDVTTDWIVAGKPHV